MTPPEPQEGQQRWTWYADVPGWAYLRVDGFEYGMTEVLAREIVANADAAARAERLAEALRGECPGCEINLPWLTPAQAGDPGIRYHHGYNRESDEVEDFYCYLSPTARDALLAQQKAAGG